MKKLLLIAITAISLQASKAQNIATDTIPAINGQYGYQEVVQLDTNYKKDNLFKTAKNYFVDEFKDANSVIQYQDELEGKIIGKGNFKLSATANMGVRVDWLVSYTTEIVCKDNKYRYRFYDILVKNTQYGSGYSGYDKSTDVAGVINNMHHGNIKKQTTKLYKAAANEFSSTAANLKMYMAKNGKSKSQSDF